MKRFTAITVMFLLLINLLCGCLILDNTQKFEVFIIMSDNTAGFKTVQTSMENSIEELGYKDKINFKRKNAKGDAEKLDRYLKNADDSNADLIIAVETETASAAKNAEINTPVVFIDVPYPIENKIVSAFDITNENITGISCNVPVEKVFELAYTIDSNVDTVTLIYDSEDNTSLNDIIKAKELCELIGLKYNSVIINDIVDALEQSKEVIKNSDFIYMPYSVKGEELIPELSEFAQMRSIPVYTNNMNMVKKGAFASVEVNYNALGQQTAQMIVRILGGVTIKNTSVENAKEYITYINSDTAEILDIDIPKSLNNTYIPITND